MSGPVTYKLTEEVVRWSFEVVLRGTKSWWIAFTNPTAGPWKRLMGRDSLGAEGEVYRFPRDEDRPDVVAVDDARKILLIVEAKDTASKLLNLDQIAKSCQVVQSLAAVLRDRSRHSHWRERSQYDIVAGLLWGQPFGESQIEPAKVLSVYQKRLTGLPVVGFKVEQESSGELRLREYWHSSSKRPARFAKLISDSNER